MLMVITASILQAADKKRRERQRQSALLRQRATLLQDLLVDESNNILSPRLRLLVLHKLRNIYGNLSKLNPADPRPAERLEQTIVMMSAIQEQLGEPFEPALPTTPAGLSDAKNTIRTLGKLLSNMIDAHTISPKDSGPLKMDLQHAMLELQIKSHELAAKDAMQEKRWSVAVHNCTTCINLLQRSQRPDKLAKMEEFQVLATDAQRNIQAVNDAKSRERAKQERDWQELSEDDGIFKKKHAYDD
jgi:hypothetical protein